MFSISDSVYWMTVQTLKQFELKSTLSAFPVTRKAAILSTELLARPHKGISHEARLAAPCRGATKRGVCS